MRRVLASSIAAIVALTSVGQLSARAEDANVFLLKTVATATLTPTIGLSLGVGPGQNNAIPGDRITYTSTLTNSGAIAGISGQIILGNGEAPEATVVAYWDVVSTIGPSADHERDSGSATSSSTDRKTAGEPDRERHCAESGWKPLAGQAANDPTWTVVKPAPIATGLTLTATGVPKPGVTFPASGDPFLGTILATNATARWNYTAALNLSPDQVKFLLDRTKVCAVRNSIHIELRRSKPVPPSPDHGDLATKPSSDSGDAASKPSSEEIDLANNRLTYSTDFSTRLLTPGRSGDVTLASIVINPPTGASTTFNSITTPALMDIPPGVSVTVTLPYQVATIAPRGAGETEADYPKRLKAADGLALTATASAKGTGSNGALSAVAPPVTTFLHVPVVTIAKSGPATVDAGTSASYPLALSNSGGATAGPLSVVDTVPNGTGGAVTGVPATLAPGATAAATATFPVPTTQPTGPLTDTAQVSWQDANTNPYGPVSSQFTTQVHNNLFGASLALAPTSAGPNVPGTTQTLTATLLDRNGLPIANQVISFSITGANPQTGTVTTGANGKAVFTYTGNNAGNDVAQATASAPGITLNSNTATISWGRMLQPVATTPVQGNFFANPTPPDPTNTNGNCTFGVGPSSTPVFGQTFPDILFNPPAGAVPHNISNVNGSTRPFTDLTVDVNGNYNGQIVAQGNGQQAGVGSLTNFYATFTGSFIVNQPGDLTFTILHDDGYILGIGNGATRVNGDLLNDPVTTPFNGYGVIAAWNGAAANPNQPGTATAHFPAAGTYPYELDYSECGGGGPNFLVLQIAQFVAQTDPLSIYVGYADGLRAGALFPFPWQGSTGVTFVGGCTMDSGAIRFDNSGDTAITLDKVTVVLPPPSTNTTPFDLWSATPLVVPAHQILILAQTGCYNFDTSDYSSAGCGANNGAQPQVNVTVGGVTKTYTETHQILNTRGFDLACRGNESIPWERIAGTANAVNVPVPPAFSLDISPFSVPGALLGQNQVLTVSAMDGAGNPIVNLPVTLQVFGPNAQTLNGTTLSTGLATFGYVGVTAGTDSTQASASIGGLHVISNLGSVTWTAPAGGGPNPLPDPNAPPPPAITAPSPTDGSIVTKPVAVTATIAPPTGQTIASWRVFYQALDPGPLVTIAAGSGAPPATLATFDPTVLANDTYGITVEATASGGGIQDLTTTVTVLGNLKPGRYTTTYQDLSVPVGGFQMEVRRTYDSIDKSSGDFGVGWRLSVSNFRTAPNRVLGAAGWTQYNKSCTLGLCFTGFKNAAPRFVTVTFPDQHSEVFDFTPNGGTNLFWECSPAFTARDKAGLGGTASTLLPLDDTTCSYVGDGNLNGSSGGPYDPHRFRLTTRQGAVLVLDRTSGLVSETDPNGNSLSIDNTGIHASNGQSVTYTRDGLRRITAIAGPSGQTLSYAYNASGDLVSSADPLGNVTTYAYDSRHDLTAANGPGGTPLQTLVYDGNGRLTAISDAAGNTTTVSNDVPGQRQVLTDPLGQLTTALHYDDLGDLIQEDQVFGGQTSTTLHTYDAVGRETSVTNPLGATKRYTYDAGGNLTSQTDEVGQTVTMTYNSAGQLLSVVAPDGSVSVLLSYDARGRLLQQTQASGAVYGYGYDAAGHLVSATDPAGGTATYTFDPLGHPASIASAGGQTSRLTTDASGRVLSRTEPLGATTHYTYDAAGNLVSLTDAAGGAVTYTYDALDRQTSATDQLGHTTTYSYDSVGQLVRRTDRNGAVTTYTYDGDGRLTSQALPNETTTYGFDGASRLLSASNASATLRYTYDAAGQRTQQTSGGAAGVSLPTIALSYAYDAAGRPTTISGPDGVSTYTYDSLSRIHTIADAAGGTFGFSYDANSRLSSVGMPNGITDTLTWDSRGNLTSRTARLGAGTSYQATYNYDASSLRTALADGDGAHTFTHDVNGRLTAAAHPAASSLAAERYTYDAVGNRTAAGTSTAAFDRANRIVTDGTYNYTFDAEGDMVLRVARVDGSTTTFTWNADHQLLGITYPDSSVSSYRYDALGRRVEARDGAVVHRYGWEGSQVRWEYDGANNLTTSYLAALGPGAPLEIVRGGTRLYPLTDGNGSVVALTDAAGAVVANYRYDSYGRMSTGTADPNSFTYAGQQFDSKSGLYYDRARYYDPGTGRFLSEDPLASINAYPYAAGDPVDFIDPSGALFAEYAQRLSAALEESELLDLAETLCNELALVQLFIETASLMGALGEAISQDAYRQLGGDVSKPTSPGDVGGPVNGRNRLPDIRVDRGGTTSIAEVKNVAKQSLTQQLRDSIQIAKGYGSKLTLITRASTKLSGPLALAARNGALRIVKCLPG